MIIRIYIREKMLIVKEEIGIRNLVCNMNSCFYLQIKGNDYILISIDIIVLQMEVVIKNMMRCRYDIEKNQFYIFIGNVIRRIFFVSVKFSNIMIYNMIVVILLFQRIEDRVYIVFLGGDNMGFVNVS